MQDLGGRDRRRTDLYGRARRFLYGILLLFAAPGVMAADEMAAIGKYGASLREGLKVNLAIADVGVMHVKVSSSPQVRMEFADTKNGFKPVEASLKYDNAGGFSEEKVAQVTMKWRL